MIRFKDGWRLVSRKAARPQLKLEPYDPDAKDGDGDGIVQEGTAWERPVGTRFLRMNGRPIPTGLETANRPSTAKLVDADGNEVEYTPTYERSGYKPLGTTIGETVGNVAKPNASSETRYSPARIVTDDPNEVYEKWKDDIPDMVEAVREFDERDGDLALRDIYERQGFDGLPEVIPADQWDQFLKDNKDHIPAFRGVRARRYGDPATERVEAFRSGDYWPGVGMYGNGTYTSSVRKGGEMYADDETGLIEMAIRPDAKILDWRRTGKRFDPTAIDIEPSDAYDFEEVFRDPGRAAAMQGYDVMVIEQRDSDIPGEKYYVILNRTAVVVKGAE